MRWRCDAGFTLLELLVAITLLSFLTVALIGGLRIGGRIWQKSQSASLTADAVRAAQKRLTEEITQIYPRLVLAGSEKAYIDFDGAADRMDFVSAAPTRSGEMQHVILQTIPDGDTLDLQYSEKGELERAGTAPLMRRLLPGVSTLQFSYSGFDKDAVSPIWHDTWQHRQALPLLIRIRIILAQPKSVRWPDMIVAPKIAADVGCTFDSLTKFCQGRT